MLCPHCRQGIDLVTQALARAASRSRLTPHQKRLLPMLMDASQTYAEIAGLLGTSETNIATQAWTLLRKFGVRSRADLIVHLIGMN